MKRRLNPKAFLITVVAFVSLGGVVFAVHGYQMGRSSAGLLTLAEKTEKRGDLARSVDYLGRYLVYVPENVDAQAKYGLLLASNELSAPLETRKRALAILEKVLRKRPDRLDLRERLVDVAMDLQEFEQARPHLQILHKAKPAEGDLEYRLGRCEEANGRFDEAVRWYRQAKLHTPGKVDSYVRMAELLRFRLNQAREADRVMDAVTLKDGLIAANGQSAEAYLARSRYREKAGLSGVADDVAQALKLAPDDAAVILAAADLAKSRTRGARGHLGRGSSSSRPTPPCISRWLRSRFGPATGTKRCPA